MSENIISIEEQCAIRLANLFKQSHGHLIKSAYQITKNTASAQDMCAELYEYLHIKCNPKLWWGDSYNLLYCQRFLKHRYLNKTKKTNRISYREEIEDNRIDEEYDIQLDLDMEVAYVEVMQELKALEATRMWPASKLAQMYWTSEDTMSDVAHKVSISKSTMFLAQKKIKKYLREYIKTPFNKL
jgi:hypothetical protein